MLKRAALVCVVLAIAALGLMAWGAEAQTPPPETSSLLVKLVPGLTVDEQAAVVARNGGTETGAIQALRLHVVEVLTVELADTIARYEADPQVQHVEENRVRRSEMLSNDALAVDQWALPQIGWDLVFGTVAPTGTAKVAILDTGIDASHPDLAGRVVAGTSILDGSDGRTDSSGHGTQVAGIVAANTDNAAGVAGVAFAGVQLMPVTVLDANGEGRDSDVIAGVIWAADHGADVILMAFSNPGFSPNLQEAIDYAWSRGAVLVAAIGNDGAGTPTFPAGDRGVVGVSGTDPGDALLGFSNYGQAAFLAAPGDGITTTTLGGYVSISGTSSSAAIVAGVAAFLKAVDPALTNGMIVGRMARTADPAGTQEETGNGRVNMARALEDTGTDEIQPAGADPVGDGGPFVGPYVAAAVNLNTHAPVATNNCNTTSTKTTFNLGDQACARATGLGSDVHRIEWYSPSTALKDTSANSTGGNFQDTYTPDSTGIWTVKAIKVSNGSISASAAFTVVASDTTAPTITPNISGTAGANGWYVSDVTVTWTVTDPESTITSTTGCDSTTLTAESTGTTLTCTATSSGGTNSESVTIKLDKTGPSATLSVTAGTAGANGWYTSDVTVHTAGVDSISSPVTCTADQFQTAETTGTVFNGSCTNNAGLTTNAAPVTIKLDKTKPTITITTPPNGAIYLLNQPVAANYTCTDGTSGIDTCAGTVANGTNIDTLTVGSHSFTVNAKDLAGNTNSTTNTYAVHYDFHGFFQPVENPIAWNRAKAGSAIPVKFSLTGNQGLLIFAAGYPRSRQIACNDAVPMDDIEATVNAGGSSLQYDPGADQYIYVWKTEKGWAGTCRQLEVQLNDGTTHYALFNFK